MVINELIFIIDALMLIIFLLGEQAFTKVIRAEHYYRESKLCMDNQEILRYPAPRLPERRFLVFKSGTDFYF